MELPDGSLVVVGFTTNHLIQVTGEWTEDVFLIKTNAAGGVIWEKTVGLPTFKEQGNGITRAANGDLVVAGSFREQTASPGDVDFYAVRLDDQGNVIWDNTYGFSGFDDNAKAIAPSEDGNFVLAGGTNAVQGGAGVLMKIDGSGNPFFMWQTTFPLAYFNSIAADTHEGFFVAGRKDITGGSQGDLYIARVNKDGEKLCDAVVGKAGADESYGVVATSDGGAALEGASTAQSVEDLDELVARRATTREIRQAALHKGFRTLADDGCRRVLEGETSLEELSRVVDLTDRLSP